MRFLLPVLLSIAVCLQGQQEHVDLLQRVREKALTAVDRLPRYMCTQTVDRRMYEPDVYRETPMCGRPGANTATGLHLATSDRLRLNVTVANKTEIYSWVGDDHFADQSLFELVGSGPLSTGSYAAFFRMIFSSDDPAFTNNGEVAEGNRKLVEFEFQTSAEKSHYRFGNGRQRWTVPYKGTLLVDPKTYEVVKLVVQTVDLPAESGACETKTTLRYGHVTLNDSTVLLPLEAKLRILDANGREKENHTVYAACHEFVGESKLSFEPVSESEQLAVKPQQQSPAAKLPARSRFKLALAQDIDTSVVAAGDLLVGKLTTPIRDGGGKVLVPQGAAVKGRILSMEQRHWPGQGLAISYKVDAIEFGGSSFPLSAISDAKDGGKTAPVKRVRSAHSPYGVRSETSGYKEQGTAILNLSHTSRDGVIHRGVESNWMTVEPK